MITDGYMHDLNSVREKKVCPPGGLDTFYLPSRQKNSLYTSMCVCLPHSSDRWYWGVPF